MENTFLPITKNECLARGWDEVDFVYVSGDATVPSPPVHLKYQPLKYPLLRTVYSLKRFAYYYPPFWKYLYKAFTFN